MLCLPFFIFRHTCANQQQLHQTSIDKNPPTAYTPLSSNSLVQYNTYTVNRGNFVICIMYVLSFYMFHHSNCCKLDCLCSEWILSAEFTFLCTTISAVTDLVEHFVVSIDWFFCFLTKQEPCCCRDNRAIDAAVNFGTYRTLQRHRAVFTAIATLST